jgi:ribosome-associated protein
MTNDNFEKQEQSDSPKQPENAKSVDDKQVTKSWTYSAVNRADSDRAEDEYVSKTELKNDAKQLHRFGKELILLSAEKISLLPLNETTQTAIGEFHKQIGNIAKKRHLAFIAKCLRNDDMVMESMKVLELDSFAQLRAVAAHEKTQVKSEQRDKETLLIKRLLADGDQQIQQLVEKYPELDRQTLRQLVRNISKAKTEPKQLQARKKVLSFMADNKIDLTQFND